jgi:hypothetical protein
MTGSRRQPTVAYVAGDKAEMITPGIALMEIKIDSAMWS